MIAFSREWAMPNPNTFDVGPIGEFVRRHLRGVTVDPFARNNQYCEYTNDIDPGTSARYHMDAEAFLRQLRSEGVKADVVVFDPPYSPRQISECYKSIGLPVSAKETQNSVLYKRVRDAIVEILAPGATVISFGWNTVGMGKSRGFVIDEIMLCCHGGAHNDTLCLAESKP